MHYTPTIDQAFNSVEHITRDVKYGWIIRFMHQNTVSQFFICVYIHIGRGQYYGSYRSPRRSLWIVGVLIFQVMMGEAFQGYVQPFGQMSLWGAVVITNQLSSIPWIGSEIVKQIWGGFSVDNPTQNRFFALHYQLPFVLALLVILHLIAQHSNKSSNPLGITSRYDRMRFHPYSTSKDQVGFVILYMVIGYFVHYDPHYMGHSDNAIRANAQVTPASIVPEWYFQPFYCIQRSIPHKQMGVQAMIGSIQIQIPVSQLSSVNKRSNEYKPIQSVQYWVFVQNFQVQMWQGQKPIGDPYTQLGQVCTIIYFSYFIVQMVIG